ncbi:MAG TPA: DUF1801 domain-containing protein [Actinomycetota bacterium]|nr:DUF1801 domain-containing protein [Actinomycetota bacterium]
MAEAAVEEYLKSLAEPRRSEVRQIHDFIRRTVSDLEPYMERQDMIGYGRYHYRYATGREGESCIIGLSSRKAHISVYAMGGDGEQYVAERMRHLLPKADIGKSCIRFKRLEQVDFHGLGQILKASKESMEPLRVAVEG